jgi:hypothetical protein
MTIYRWQSGAAMPHNTLSVMMVLRQLLEQPVPTRRTDGGKLDDNPACWVIRGEWRTRLSQKRSFLRNILIPRDSAGWLRKAIEEDYVLLIQAEPKDQHLSKEESQQTQITGYASQSSNVRVAIKARTGQPWVSCAGLLLVIGLLQTCNINFLHLQHCLHDSFCFYRIRISYHLI